MNDDEPRYVPAAGREALTGLYDIGVRLTMRERLWRPLIVEEIAAIEPRVVVDVGCGTGTLTIAAADRLRDSRVIGVDGDPKILEIARRKSGAERVEWVEGLADGLPVDDGEVGALMTTLLFHHLPLGTKRAALAEAHRALCSGGRLVVGDWGKPQDLVMSATFLALRSLDGFATTADNRRGMIPELIAEAGFERFRILRRLRTIIGTFEIMTAERP